MGLSRLKPLGLIKSAGGAIGSSLSPIGVDFGVGSLKILQVENPQAPQLVAAACFDTPDDLLLDPAKRLEWQTEQLAKAIRSNGFKGKRAVCTIPAQQTLCKSVQIQMTGGVDVGSVIQAGMAEQLQCDPNSIVCRFSDAGECGSGKQHEFSAMAVGRELVSSLMQSLRNAKLEPVGMHSVFEASIAAFPFDEDNKEPVLYVDIGTGGTAVAISHGSTLAFARLVEMSGQSLDSFVARQLKMSDQAAREERWGATELIPSQEQAETEQVLSRGDGPVTMQRAVGKKLDLSEPIEIIADDIQLCMRYHATRFPGSSPKRVVFMGGESAHTGLCTAIAKNLRLPAQIADPMARVARSGSEPCEGVDLSEPQPAWTVPLGLCLAKTDL